jgi:hypothetical protein
MLEESCPLYEEKSKILSHPNEFVKKFRIQENMLEGQVTDMFSYLRFMLFDGDVNILLKIISDNKYIYYDEIAPSFYLITPITIELEIKVLLRIKEIMEEHLANYETTAEVTLILTLGRCGIVEE